MIKVLQDEHELVIAATVPTPFAFNIGPTRCYIAPPEIPPPLPITFRIRDMQRIGDLYKCVMVGSNAAVLSFHLSADDVQHNLMFAASMVA